MKRILFLSLLVSFISCGGGSSRSDSSPTEDTPESTSTNETSKDPLKDVELVSPDGSTIRTSIAYTPKDQTDGLQNVLDSEFDEDEGKLFFYLTTSSRTFWMPNTYFDLDIIYLDENLKIIDIVWDMPHYTGEVNSEIPRAPSIRSRHVLEMEAGSPVSSKLKIGDTLKWESSLTLDQTEDEIRDELKGSRGNFL